MVLHVISPNGTVLKTESDMIILPGVEGIFTVLEGHAPMIAALTKGEIKFQLNGEMKEMEIESGFAEIADDLIKVCID
ncbi:MAG: F0F1 ATP synthase subunit epsilon [Bacteroidales bacterium]